jgi:hypothetical protein
MRSRWAGKFRFLNPRPASTVSLALQGFATTIRDMSSLRSALTDLPVQLKVAAVAETVTVSGGRQ